MQLPVPFSRPFVAWKEKKQYKSHASIKKQTNKNTHKELEAVTSLYFGDKAVGGGVSLCLHSTLAAIPISKSMRGSVALRVKKKKEEIILNLGASTPTDA